MDDFERFGLNKCLRSPATGNEKAEMRRMFACGISVAPVTEWHNYGKYFANFLLKYCEFSFEILRIFIS